MNNQDLLKAIDDGNSGKLRIGAYLFDFYANGGKSLDHIEAWLETQGRTLDSPSQLSKYKGAYESWVVNAGFEIDQPYFDDAFTDDAGNHIPMRLSGVSVYRLYASRNLIDRSNPTKSLVMAYRHSQRTLEDMAASKGEQKPEIRTLKLPLGDYEQVKMLARQMQEIDSNLTLNNCVMLLVSFMSELRLKAPDNFVDIIRGFGYGNADY